MIVLHEHKLIALKPRKVGGTSFEIALSKYASESSIITSINYLDEKKRKELGFRGPQNNNFTWLDIVASPLLWKRLYKKKRMERFYNHMTAVEARKELSCFDSYTKIAIVRNPFDFAVSMYFWDIKKEGKPLDFESWCIENKSKLAKNIDQYKIDGENVIDFYIRFDRMKEDILELEKIKIGLNGLWETFSKIKTKHKIRPKSASYQEMFINASEARSIISNLYSDEISNFGFNAP